MVAGPLQAQQFTEAANSSTGYNKGTLKPALDCAALAQLKLRDVIKLKAESIAAANGAPAHCRVSGTIAPEINFQVSLPLEWNGRFYMTGNGAFAGQQPGDPFNAANVNAALSAHFAMAATDTGHDAAKEPGATFASNPQKIIDYAYRAVHVTAVTAKDITKAFYAKPVQKAYWNSCSNGGRQGLVEAQRYPDDFDGIIAVAPWVSQTGFSIGTIWNQQALATANLTAGKLATLAKSVMDKCDAVDGVKDGLIDDPRKCAFNATKDVPICKAGADSDACLTSAQAVAVQKVYDGPRNSAGKQLFPGFMPGSEAVVPGANGAASSSWLGFIAPASPTAKPADFGLGEGMMQYLAPLTPNPKWDYKTFDFDNGPDEVTRWARLVDATDINLRAFRAKGGKLIITYGWADQVLQPLAGVNYYEQAVTANGANGTDFMRLFMVPGMTHCAGGVGPDQHDLVTAVVDWVETNKAPALITTKKIVGGKTERSRPLCPYPQVAKYKGQGSIDEAANFSCQ
jgi:feruloyl esterase